jgi:hypothetical protein
MQPRIVSRTLISQAWALVRLAFVLLTPRHRKIDFSSGPEDINWEDTQ